MNVRTLLSKLASVTVLRLGVAALGFGLFWLLSHQLSATELGGFSVLMNTFLLLQVLPLLGLHVHLIREVAARPEQQAREISHALAFASPFAVLLGIGVCLYGLVAADAALRLPFVLLGLAMLPTAWTLVAESALIGREQLRVLTWVNVLESAWRLGGAGLAIWQGWGLSGVFAMFLAGRVFSAALYAQWGGLPTPKASMVTRVGLRLYLTQAPTYLAIGLVSAACSRLDMLLLSHLRGLEDVGVYAAAAKLYEASLMVSTMALMIVYPVLARLFASDRAQFATMLARCVRWGLLLGVPLVLIGMAVAPVLVHVLYVPKLWGAAPVLQALLLAAWLMAMDQLLSGTTLAAQAQRHDLQAMVVGLITLLALLMVLSPALGPLGTAWAVVAGLALRVLWRIRWAQAYLQLPGLLSQAGRLALAASASVAAFWAVNAGEVLTLTSPVLQTVMALAVGLLVHAAVAVLTGAFDARHRHDWAAWRQPVRHVPEVLS